MKPVLLQILDKQIIVKMSQFSTQNGETPTFSTLCRSYHDSNMQLIYKTMIYIKRQVGSIQM